MDTAYWLLRTKQKFKRKRFLYFGERLFYSLIIPLLVIILSLIHVFVQDKKKLCNLSIARLYRIFDRKNTLLKEGVIVWGYIIQANLLLFKPVKNPSCAAIVYSLDPDFNDDLTELHRIAKELYELKNKPIEHPELLDLKEIATALTNQRDTLINVQIPDSVAIDKVVYYTTIPVYRKDLPLNYLPSCWVPLLVAPNKTGITRILPARYWSSSMLKAWCQK